VLKAILNADMIVVDPEASTPAAAEPARSRFARQFASRREDSACNIATHRRDGFVFLLLRQRLRNVRIMFDVILCNENDKTLPEGSLWVRADEKTLSDSRAAARSDRQSSRGGTIRQTGTYPVRDLDEYTIR
jgi:hypothetical protein